MLLNRETHPWTNDIVNNMKSHNEAQFEPCCKSVLFIIHLRLKTLCIFIDFHVLSIKKQVAIFVLSRCV